MSSQNGTQKRLSDQHPPQAPWKARVCPVFTHAKLSRPAPEPSRLAVPGQNPVGEHDRNCVVACLGHECMFFRELQGPNGTRGFDCALSLTAMAVGEVGQMMAMGLSSRGIDPMTGGARTDPDKTPVPTPTL